MKHFDARRNINISVIFQVNPVAILYKQKVGSEFDLYV